MPVKGRQREERGRGKGREREEKVGSTGMKFFFHSLFPFSSLILPSLFPENYDTIWS
jgi:hypothetical protein